MTASEMATIDETLLNILACPEDKGPLYCFADFFYNPRLKRKYEIRDGIPVMLMDEAETVADSEHEELLAEAERQSIRWTFEA